jgi:4-hydroxybenzoate polyprenyltransferase/phosphoserine phosphatase
VSAPAPTDVALAIDLDGTLVRTDVLIECTLQLLARDPLAFIALLGGLARGRAEFKRRVAARAAVDAAHLPYEPRVVELARAARAAGREVVLATAAAKAHADAVAAQLGCFDRVLATADGSNLSAGRKAAALVGLYGERGYDYAGNARADRAVWKSARGAIVVNPRPGAARLARDCAPVLETIDTLPPRGRTLLRALRPHQWAKNLLVGLPLLTAHRLADPLALAHTAIAFVVFCAVASAVYLVNDLVDLPHDRAHPSKRARPFAAGALPPQFGLAAAPLLFAAGVAAAAALSTAFATMVLAYAALTLAYSFGIKRIAMLDVIVLSLLYTVRVLAGAAAIPVVASFWLLAFSTFLFLSLAMAKRYVELGALAAAGAARGRGYVAGDAPMVARLGTAAGLVSVLVLALYIDSAGVAPLYRQPDLLWALCLLLLYWIGRVWLLAQRGLLHEDPVVFALTDRTSLVLMLAAGAVIFAAAVA